MSCCVVIEQSEVGIIESCGKFTGPAAPGCHCLVPCKDTLAGKVSLRLEELNCSVESKSKDNVFVQIVVSIQYQVLRSSPDGVPKAFYSLENPIRQIEAYVHNSIRGQVPKYDVDQLYLMRSEISASVKQEIDHHMADFGYEIVNALMTDINPARAVADAMNQIQTYQRLKAATVDKAEAQKIQVVRAAEADAEAKRLSGVGLAEQRKAIVAGLQSSIETFQEGVPGLGSEDIMSLLLLNQYFDTLKDVAKNSRGVTLFMSHSGGLREVAQQMENGVMTSHKKTQ